MELLFRRAAREAGASNVKVREDRQKVMIRARMRSHAAWHDVCILNLSRHGLGIQASKPPERGTYVEIRRGNHVIVARVAWIKGHRAGLRAQDPIVVQCLIGDDSSAPQSAPQPWRKEDRRRVPRTTAEAHAHSRLVSRAVEFACFGLLACLLGFSAFGAVEEALARPFAQIRTALG